MLMGDRNTAVLVLVAKWLSERGAIRSADLALAWAARRSPKSADIRLARRKLPILRLSRLDIDAVTDLMQGAKIGATFVSAKPVTAGFSPATASIAKIDFEAGGERFSVVAKEYRRPPDSPPGWAPREIGIGLRANGISGEIMRFPLSYGVLETERGQPLAISEWVNATGFKQGEGRRARALGELAGLNPDDFPELRDFIRDNPEYQRGGVPKRGFAVAAELVGQIRVGSLNARLKDQMTRVPDLNARYAALPLRFAHGDAQAANLLLDENGRVVFLDIGNMRLAPIGYDLATIMSTRLRNDRVSPGRDVIIEARSFKNFTMGVEAFGGRIGDRDLDVAYATGLCRLIQNSGKRMAVLASKPDKIERELRIIDRYLSALSRTLDRLS